MQQRRPAARQPPAAAGAVRPGVVSVAARVPAALLSLLTAPQRRQPGQGDRGGQVCGLVLRCSSVSCWRRVGCTGGGSVRGVRLPGPAALVVVGSSRAGENVAGLSSPKNSLDINFLSSLVYDYVQKNAQHIGYMGFYTMG